MYCKIFVCECDTCLFLSIVMKNHMKICFQHFIKANASLFTIYYAYVGCKNNLVINNGIVHFYDEKETLFQETIEITCHTGYQLYGDNTTTCQHDGSWSMNSVCRLKGKSDIISSRSKRKSLALNNTDPISIKMVNVATISQR